MSLRILSAANVEHLVANLALNELLSHTAKLFHQLSHESEPFISNPIRSTATMSNHTLLMMPAHVNNLGTSVKLIAVPSSTVEERRPGLAATTVYFDSSSGVPKCILNARHLTALRTAAGSLLATRLLVSSPPKRLVLFGAGLQIQYHAELILSEYSTIETCYILNRSTNLRATALYTRLSRNHPTKSIRLMTRDEEGVDRIIRTCDILCFATPSRVPLVESSWVKAGAHIILVGSYTRDMHEIPTELVKRASKIVVDSREHAMHEAGELIAADCSDLVELGELVNSEGVPITGTIGNAQIGNTITLFKSVGLAVQASISVLHNSDFLIWWQDVMIAHLLTLRAETSSIGTVIDNFD